MPLEHASVEVGHQTSRRPPLLVSRAPTPTTTKRGERKKRKEKSTPSGVITGASVRRSSPRRGVLIQPVAKHSCRSATLGMTQQGTSILTSSSYFVYLSIIRSDLDTQIIWQLEARHPSLHAGHLVPKHLSLLQLLTCPLQCSAAHLTAFVAVQPCLELCMHSDLANAC